MDMTNRKAQSDGLWKLTWKRLRADRVAMCSMGIVLLFLVMIVLSASGLVASDWSREVGVHYAPPDFVGEQAAERQTQTAYGAEADLPPENPVDPLRDVLRQLRKSMLSGQAVFDDYGIADPLQEELDVIRQAQQAEEKNADDDEGRLKTLPFGADKWGHDVIKKIIDSDSRFPRQEPRNYARFAQLGQRFTSHRCAPKPTL